MNTALIAHILNQRLAKGEIWPPWWGRHRWSRTWVAPFLYFWVIVAGRFFFAWIAAADYPIVAVGRSIYFVALAASSAILFSVPFIQLQPRLQREIQPVNLQLSLIAYGSAYNGLTTWLVADYAVLFLRLFRLFPLYAFAAMAGGISWTNAASFALFVSLIAAAVLAVLYAATITDPTRFMVKSVVIAAVAWWVFRNIHVSLFTFGPGYNALPRYLAGLLLTTAVALAWAAAALEIRVRWHGRFIAAPRRRLVRLPSLLRRWPVVALLVRGMRRGLGIFGSMPAVIVTTAAAIGIGLIPLGGGFILLISLTLIVPQFILALHRAGVWEDVYLAADSQRHWELLPSNDARDWARALIAACCVATLPVLPGLAIHVIRGGFGLGGNWTPYAIAGEVAAQLKNPLYLVPIMLAIGAAAVACAAALAAAFIAGTIEEFVRRAMKPAVPLGYATGTLALMFIVPIVIIVLLVPFFRGFTSSSVKAIWLTVAYSTVGLIAAAVAVNSYHNLCQILADARGLSASEYDQAWRGWWRKNEPAPQARRG